MKSGFFVGTHEDQSPYPKIILIIQGILELAAWCYDGKSIEKLNKHTLI